MTKTSSFALTAVTTCVGIGSSVVLIRHFLLPTLRRRATLFITSMLAEAKIYVDEDIEVKDDSIFLDWMNRGMLAIGESYMAGQWTIKEDQTTLDDVLTRLMSLPPASKRKLFKSWNARFVGLAARTFNYQSPSRAGIVGSHHYDLGNEFYRLWLDPYMQYSCAYWKDATDLEEAQMNKLHLIAQKLKLEPGMKILEIGCGWGGLGCFLAKHYGVHVTGITISNEQLKGAREWAEREGLSDLTSFSYCDYRKMEGQFDRVVSIAMLEAVGYKNMDEYYHVISRCLKPTGLALVHSICANRSTKIAYQRWILKYIFPNGFLPSLTQMLEFSEKKQLIVEDCHNFGPDYDLTLMEWNKGFQKYCAQGDIDRGVVFKRMFEFYLMYCAAGFRARTIQLNQVVYSKQRMERYDAVR